MTTPPYDAATMRPTAPKIKVVKRDGYKTTVQCSACPAWVASFDPSHRPEVGDAFRVAGEHAWHAHTRQLVDIELRYI